MSKIETSSAIQVIVAGAIMITTLTSFTQSAGARQTSMGTGEANSLMFPDSLYPGRKAAKRDKIQSLVERGHTEEALHLADQIVKDEPNNYKAWINRTDLRIGLGWQTNIQWDAWYGLALKDDQPHSYRQLGVSFTRLSRFDDAHHMLALSKIWLGSDTSKLLLAATAELKATKTKAPETPSTETLQKGQSAYGEENYKSAFTLFLKAAEAGNPSAMGNVAHMYSQGLGTTVDNDRAAIWFKKGSEHGAREAMYRYSKILNKGLGVPLDHKAAASWLKKSAEYGYAQAMFELGSSYLRGDGVTRNHKLAVAYFRAAAEQNHSSALYYLGHLFETGEGVPHNSSKAAEWIAEAVNQQDKFATEQLTQFHHQWSRDFRREMQIILRDLGLYQGKEDGNFETDTISAIKALASDE